MDWYLVMTAWAIYAWKNDLAAWEPTLGALAGLLSFSLVTASVVIRVVNRRRPS